MHQTDGRGGSFHPNSIAFDPFRHTDRVGMVSPPGHPKKDEARRALRAARRLIPKEQADAAARRLRDLFLSVDVFRHRKIVAGYWPMGAEIDVRPLLTSLKGCWQTALPVVTGKANDSLAFRAWSPGDGVEPGLMGISVPTADARVLRPDLLLVPLIGFDRAGYRLGQGGGFYDRTLAALRAEGPPPLAVGVAFAQQELAAVPREPHDQRLDYVLTETFVLEIG